MTNYSELEIEFMDKGLAKGTGVIILNADDAVNLIKKCKNKKYKIYGLDAFFMKNGTQPSIEHSIDFGDKHYEYEKAITIITNRPIPELCYEVICEA